MFVCSRSPDGRARIPASPDKKRGPSLQPKTSRATFRFPTAKEKRPCVGRLPRMHCIVAQQNPGRNRFRPNLWLRKPPGRTCPALTPGSPAPPLLRQPHCGGLNEGRDRAQQDHTEEKETGTFCSFPMASARVTSMGCRAEYRSARPSAGTLPASVTSLHCGAPPMWHGHPAHDAVTATMAVPRGLPMRQLRDCTPRALRAVSPCQPAPPRRQGR